MAIVNGSHVASHEGNPKNAYSTPQEPSGSLEGLSFEDVTPIIGREFPTVNVVDDILNAPNADERLRDLAITISQRGVVFFRKQDNLTNELQKELVHRLGALTGAPKESTLHTHPIFNDDSEFGLGDAHISHISSVAQKEIFKYELDLNAKTRTRSRVQQWHSDIQFEPVPAAYTSLRLVQLPKTGGDTLWASGYEIYNRFSPAYQKFLGSLTATFSGENFIKAAAANPEKVRINEGPRGNPQNVGKELQAVHPVVRTNPVTGWKSIFSVGAFPRRINELTQEESDELLAKFKRVILENHDLTVRFKWRNEHDLAIWDNRSFFHTATWDYEGLGDRSGVRTVGIGEPPY